MKSAKRFLTLAFFVSAFAACNDSENEQLIIGKWQGTQWLVNGKASEMNAAGTSFSFDDKKAYTFDYGGEKQTGTYKVENNMLFTTPAGEQEIMVKITRLTKDTMVFDMNRSGQPEALTLIRTR